MSSNLSWIPVIEKDLNYLDTSIKFILRHQFGEPIDIILDCADLPYLEGVKDAIEKEPKKDILALIEAIKKYREVQLKEVW